MSEEKPYETLLVESRDGIAVVTLNRPEVLNAYNPKMGREIRAALRTLAGDAESRVVILTGAGRGFCSGADISRPKDRTNQWNPNVIRGHESDTAMSRMMTDYPKPIIAAINGVALGVGFSLTLPCDVRLASENARFGATYTRIGMVPELGSSFLLPRIVGFGKAMELVLTGRMIDAHEAHAIGLVNQLTPEGKVLEQALEMARMMLKSPPNALLLTKQALHHAAANGMLQATQFEGLAMQMCRNSSDHKEAIKAFREKREPRFTGN
ncbi:MAG TPA: enoyl-CoA hydratase-related protein [Candidatus Binataceae bacterium]|jgi:2-(1,2-epoxy-1,2-dihydrophenyl)acetyl-CoA isomerase|nr:enoyl-CoA hydratase-related protein [Candidatus Binataceae bacterium]